MKNYDITVKNALSNVLPTYHAITVKRAKLPCITYLEIANDAIETGDTLEYSRIQYEIKLYGYDLEELTVYTNDIDAIMRALGFKRISADAETDNELMVIIKSFTYEITVKEDY